MNDYSAWPNRQTPVSTLSLDARNPRLPKTTEPRDPRAILAELVQHDDVEEVARSIAVRGYFPTEVMIAVEEDGKKVVIEGNRRLAGLKLLISPDAAPEESKKKYKLIADGVDLGAISKVPVVIAPSRRAAAPIIATRHTMEQIQKWSPVQQARYFQSLIEEGLAVASVAKLVGFSNAEIAQYLRTAGVYEIACSLTTLPAEIREKVMDPRNFEASTLDRLLSNPTVRNWLGIDFDAEGKVTGKIHPDEFKKGFARIVSDLASGKESSRTLNKAKEIEAYLSKIPAADTPDPKKRGSFTADDLLKGKDGDKTIKSATPLKKPPTTAKKSRSLVPKGFPCTVSNDRIERIFRELRGLHVAKFPNASGIILRVLVELSLSHWLDTSKKSQPLHDKAKKDGKPKDWCPTLRQMLLLALDDADVVTALPPQNRKALKKATQQDDHPFSIDSMDGMVHNRYTAFTESFLRGLWSQVEELLRLTLADYKPPKPPSAPAAAKPKK